MNIASSSLALIDSAGTRGASPDAAQDLARQKEAATQLEGVFVSMLLKTMRETMTEGEMFGNDTADIWGGIFDQTMGDAIAKEGGLGMAEQLSLADAVRARTMIPTSN
jgi:Rod binding domain-containing protein